MSSLTSMRRYLFKLKKYLPKFLQPYKRPSQRQMEKKRRKDSSYPQPTALLTAYYGKNYHGLNYSWDVPTIEGEILKALHTAGVGLPVEDGHSLHKIGLQRVSRTDKGVSAAGNIVLAKMYLNQTNIMDRVNELLPKDIRIIDFVKAPKDFVDHSSCKQRTYTYTIPTYAFAPLEETVTLGYRVSPDIIEKVNEVLEKFWYSHSFHCFTMHRETLVKSPMRYIYEFECGLPFVKDGVEFCVIRIRGQSFMMHQIRKMIGLTIAIVKGYCDIETIQLCYDEIKVDIPKAPGLGLMLEKLHFSSFDDLFGHHLGNDRRDSIKAKLEDFRENVIREQIMHTEIQEARMIRWLPILHLHSYQVTPVEGSCNDKFRKLMKTLKDYDESQADDDEETDQEGLNQRKTLKNVSVSRLFEKKSEDVDEHNAEFETDMTKAQDSKLRKPLVEKNVTYVRLTPDEAGQSESEDSDEVKRRQSSC